MPDEASVPEDEKAPDTPDESGSEKTPAEDTPDIDWEQRYNDLRPEADRWRTRADQLESFFDDVTNPETQAEALARLGLTLEEATEEVEDEDLLDPDERLDRIEGYLSEREQQMLAAQEAQEAENTFHDDLAGQFVALEEREGRQLSDEEIEFIGSRVQDASDAPEVFDWLKGYAEAERERWIESKRAPQAPSGASPSHDVDLDDREQRREWLAQKMGESEQLS